MADLLIQPSSAPPASSSTPAPAPVSTTKPTTFPKPPQQNQALRMLGIPLLPRKLPSRNWLIFWTLSTSITAAIIYDKREKKRATARWARLVAPLAKEPISNPSAMPRRLTIYLSAPPGDGLRVAQDHYTEYVKPVLAASGLDWDFVQGRMQGDIRAVVAEKVRRIRKVSEATTDPMATTTTTLPTAEDVLETVRRRNNISEYNGVKGDIVIGRNTWKEYLRGLHEGWLGPLQPPRGAEPDPEPAPKEGEEAPTTPKRPPQPKPYDTVEDYPLSHIPLLIPSEFAPSTPIPYPHILGMLNTPTRLYRFFTRRRLADEIGREVAAVCFAHYREYREVDDSIASDQAGLANATGTWEQNQVLQSEESNWLKSVWEEAAPPPIVGETTDTMADETSTPYRPEKIWSRPITLDPRIAMRMRRFEIRPEDEVRARAIIVPEKEVEGVIKGSLRSLVVWSVGLWHGDGKPKPPVVGDLSEV